MAFVTLKQIECANCGHVQSAEVRENITNNLSFSNYNLFKSFPIQRCQNCGYVSNDLTIKRINYPIVCNLHENSYDIKTELLNSIKIYEKSLESETLKETKLQILVSLFNAKKNLLKIVLTENYNTRNIDTINKIQVIQNDLFNFTNSLLDFINNNKFKIKYFNEKFIDMVKIEALCVISKVQLAEELLKSLNIEDERLLEYLECCIEIGGKICSNL